MSGFTWDSDDDMFGWHHPKSFRDACEQISFNICIRSLLGLSSICKWLWKHVIKNPREYFRFKRRLRKEAMMFKEAAIIPLPQNRERPLTPPRLLSASKSKVSLPRSSKPRTVVQSQSGLCYKLPSEIRRMVWGHVISGKEGGSVLHVFRTGKRMAHWRCAKQVDGQPCSWRDPCSNVLPFNQHYCDEIGHVHASPKERLSNRTYGAARIDAGDLNGGFLGMLRSCRQIYSESISLLYTIPHFHFPCPTDIHDFHATTLPHRLNSIKVLSTDWKSNPPLTTLGRHWDGTVETRTQIWPVVSGMQGLKEFRMFMKCLWVNGDSAFGKTLLEQMRSVEDSGKLEVFQLVVERDELPFWSRELGGEESRIRIVDAGVRDVVYPDTVPCIG